MAITVTELMDELKKMPRDAYVVLVIDDAVDQMVCSGDMTIEIGETTSEVIIGGAND